jgi:hypothetical protein
MGTPAAISRRAFVRGALHVGLQGHGQRRAAGRQRGDDIEGRVGSGGVLCADLDATTVRQRGSDLVELSPAERG